MSKVFIKNGLTLPGPQDFSSFRSDVAFEVDTEGNIEEQIKECVEVAERVSVASEQALAQQAANLTGLSFEGLGIASAFKKFRVSFKREWEKLLGRVSELESKGSASTTNKKQRPASDKKRLDEEED